MPPLLTHRVADFQNIDSGTLLRSESNNGNGRVAEDVDLRDLGLDSADDPSSGGDNFFGRLMVAAGSDCRLIRS